MPFPPKLLNENEQVVLDLRPHWWFMAQPTAALVGAIVLGLFVLGNAGDEGVGYGIKIVTSLIVLGCLLWFGVRYLQWVSTNFVVTTDRVVHRVGVVAKHGIEIPLERINTVFFHQSIFERLFGLGDLGTRPRGCPPSPSAAPCARVLVERRGERSPEAGQVRAALRRVDVVREREDRLDVRAVPLHRDLDRARRRVSPSK